MIKKLSQKTSEVIKSQQYINNTYTITKELLENSLDSSATVIKILIDDESIRVDDNGKGIRDLENVGNEGFTSKEATTYYVLGLNEDNSNLYCGYRGLALCSIKNMCDLEIISKYEQSDVAFKKNLESGIISPCPRENGTTVNVTNIFKDCPIRKKLNMKNLSKDLKLIVKLVEAYALVYKIDFIVKYKGNTLINKKGNQSLKEYCKNNYRQIYEECLIKDTEDYFLFMIPRPQGKEESKIFYGKRYVTSKKILKEIRKVYNLYHDGVPLFYLELKGLLDFNISPDKSEILFENEEETIGKLKEEVRDYFSKQIYFKNNQKIQMESTLEFFKDYPAMDEPISKEQNSGGIIKLQKRSKIFPNDFRQMKTEQNDTKREENNVNFNEKNINFNPNINYTGKCNKNNIECKDNDTKYKENDTKYEETNKECEESTLSESTEDSNLKNTQNMLDDYITSPIQRQHEVSNTFVKDLEVDFFLNSDSSTNLIKRDWIPASPSSSYFNEKLRSPIAKKFCTKSLISDEEFNVKETKVELINDDLKNEEDIHSLKLEDTIFDYFSPHIPQEISLTIQKRDFYDMEVIGQFNKGFILTKLIKDGRIYLLIIDQHASDEIYNYENLKNTTKIARQKLIVPLELELSPIDKVFVGENLFTFNKYGFEIQKDKLLTMPVFKGQEFYLKDFQDLLENIKNGEYGLEKIHKILASKACRMSIMIGDPLPKLRMEKVVRNLGSLEKPWNCPHGRPTFMVIEEIGVIDTLK